MSGIGAKGMEKKGIEYRERSPLVVPPKLDLPPPASADADDAPNWPKDPDERRRKEAIAAGRRRQQGNGVLAKRRRCRPPSWMPTGRPAPTRTVNDPVQPGSNINHPTMSPAELGYTGGLFEMFSRQQGRKQAIHVRAAAPVSDRAAAGISDAFVELCLWYRRG